MAIYFLIGLLPRTIKITLKSVVRFLVACLVSELLNDKDNSHPPSCFTIRSILMTSQAGRNEITLCHIFVLNISKAKHAIKNLKADFRVSSIVLSDKPIKKYIAISL